MDALSRDELPFAGFFADVARLVLLPLTLIVMLLFARQKPPRCSNRPWAAPLPRWSPLNRWEKAADSAANVAAASLAAGDNDKSMLSLLPSQPAVECACALQLVPVVVDATQAPPAEALPSTSAPTVLPCNGNGNGQYTALSSAMALSVSSPVVASVASRIDKSNGNHTNPTSERLSSPPPYRPSLLSPSFANLHSSLTNNASPELSRQLQPITLVLDLDETLVHSSLRPLPDADFFVETQLDRGRAVFHVIKRPFMHQFLETILSWPEYRVAFFTASLRAYAEPVMDVIDPLGRISLRYFRDSCDQEGGNFSKNLVRLGMDPARSIIIDNSPVAYTRCRPNAIPIDSFFGNDPSDHQLLAILPLLDALRHVRDVRSILSLRTGSLVS